MDLGAWMAIAAGAGLLIGLEGWAWMRHGTSAIMLAISKADAVLGVLMIVAVAGTIALAMLAGVTGIDPLGFIKTSAESPTGAGGDDCHPNYKADCLDPDAYDYDCYGGSGNGPEYTSLVAVVGEDVYDLDGDSDGAGCD